jgi:hypothetical protein
MDAKLHKLALALSVSALTACGGGSSGGDDPGSTPGTETETVTAIDGYLEDAEVYVDANDNGKLDDSEKSSGPLGVTDENGEIEVSTDQFDNPLLVRAVAGQTLDSDSGAITKDFVLSADAESSYVTPFTHLATVTGKSAAELAKELNLPESLLTGDYIEAKSSTDSETVDNAKTAHALARFVVTETQKGTNSDTVSASLSDAKNKIENSSRNPDNTNVEPESDGTIAETASRRLAFTEDDLRQADTWSMFRLDDRGDNEQSFVRFGTTNNPQAFCRNSEPFGFLTKDVTVSKPAPSAPCDSTYEVVDGKLVLKNDKLRDFEFEMLHRHVSDSGVYSFLMLEDNGELFWLDTRQNLKDPGDHTITEDKTVYTFSDDDPDRDGIDYITAEKTFEITGSDSYSIDNQTGELNKGDLALQSLTNDEGVKTTFASVPIHAVTGQEPSEDDTLLTQEKSKADTIAEHLAFEYRSAGDLKLMLDHKPSAGPSENLYLASENQALIEDIAGKVKSAQSDLATLLQNHQWRVYRLGSDAGSTPEQRNASFNADGTGEFANTENQGYPDPKARPSKDASFNYTAGTDQLNIEAQPNTWKLIHQGTASEGDKSWDVLIFARTPNKLVYMDNRDASLTDFESRSINAPETWGGLIGLDRNGNQENNEVGRLSGVDFSPGGVTNDQQEGWEDGLTFSDAFSSLGFPEGGPTGVLRTDTDQSFPVKNYFLEVAGGDLSLLYHAELDDAGTSRGIEGFTEGYTLISENQDLVDSIYNAMQNK